MLDYRNTVKVRSSGRTAMRAGGGWGASSWSRDRGPSSVLDDDSRDRARSAAVRRPGVPVFTVVQDEDESQDAAVLVVGARVRHRKFGSGTIAELSGVGR